MNRTVSPCENQTTLDQFDDMYLMKQVQTGDFSKMGLLFERHNRNLFGYFYKLSGDAAKSEDLVQNLFYKMLKHRHTFKGEGKFVYWMYSIARNLWIDTTKKKDPLKRSNSLSDLNEHPADDHMVDEIYIRNERSEMMKKALQFLTTEKREAIVLSRFQGMKYHEIASISNCSENAIKSRVQRGLIDLKEILIKMQTGYEK